MQPIALANRHQSRVPNRAAYHAKGSSRSTLRRARRRQLCYARVDDGARTIELSCVNLRHPRLCFDTAPQRGLYDERLRFGVRSFGAQLEPRAPRFFFEESSSKRVFNALLALSDGFRSLREKSARALRQTRPESQRAPAPPVFLVAYASVLTKLLNSRLEARHNGASLRVREWWTTSTIMGLVVPSN
jgi:hypothetical protein